jgi:flagellar P-ring protein precursor FlgI
MQASKPFCRALAGVLALLQMLWCVPARADRLKDMATVAGVRSNQLSGFGVVVGLDGTGDKDIGVTLNSMKGIIERFGIPMTRRDLEAKNAAAVMVTAELPAFAKPGQRIDVTVSAIGKAKSIRGGSLLMTPLVGADNQIYAVAQGPVAVGGLGVQGKDGSSLSVNIPTAGTPNVVLNLNTSDFTSANRLVEAINKRYGAGTAEPLDPTTVVVAAPKSVAQKIAFASELENLDVDPGEPSARVIVNSKTGTVVISKNVRLTPAAVSHGKLTVKIQEDVAVSQPPGAVMTPQGGVIGGGGGQTVVAPKSTISAEEEQAPMFLFAPGVNLSDIVDAVNQVGTTPSDLIAILEALKQAGSLRADLIVI